MRLKSHVKYWGRNACVWTGISLACVAGFWLMNELGNARYVQGNGLAATFLVYLAVVGAFVSMIAVISTFQTEIPRLVSMNVTRKAAVWGLTAGHGATALLHILLGILIWCIFGVREAEIVVFIAALTASVMLGFGGFGMLLGALGMRFGKYAQGIFWVIWMTVCMVFPRIMGAAEDAPDSMFGRMGNAAMDFCKGVPESIWLAVLAAFSAAAMLGAYRILRKSSI